MPNKFSVQRRHWIGIVTLMFAALLLISYVPSWAAPATAPHNQTVPIPTPKPDPTSIPTATPHNDDSDDDRDDDRDDGNNDSGNGDSQEPLPDPNGTPEPETPVGDIAVDTIAVDGGVAAPSSDALFTGEVVVVRLNVRSGPDTKYDIVGTAASGDTVQLLARNEAGNWWVICCVGDAGVPGWASAQFIKPAGSRAEIGNALPIVQDLDELAAMLAAEAETEAEMPAAVEESPEIVAEEPATSELALTLVQSPPFAAQGDSIELQLTVTNISGDDATNVSIRDQLPAGLTYVSASIDGDGTVDLSNRDDAVVLRIDWPQLNAGESVNAVVSVEISSDLLPGSVLDNLVVVDANEAAAVTNGVSIGMAPIALPDF